MKVIETEIPGVLIIETDVFGDHRGYFTETYSKPKYEKLTEQQKEQVDEVITRYWCPGITLKPDDRFVFKFPTAAGGENYNYMLIITRFL